jgi:hypothetical protein
MIGSRIATLERTSLAISVPSRSQDKGSQRILAKKRADGDGSARSRGRAVSFSFWARQRRLASERSEVPVPFVWLRVTPLAL